MTPPLTSRPPAPAQTARTPGRPDEGSASHVVELLPGEPIEIARTGVVYCPYHNRWGEPAYRLAGTFTHRPLTIHASSTSGSPVMEDASGRFVGVLEPPAAAPGSVLFVGGRDRLAVVNRGPTPVAVWVADTPAAPGAHWRAYNRALSDRLPTPARTPSFWQQPEYCTWVEQKRLALEAGRPHAAQDLLDDAFVDRYLDRLDRLGLPPAKLTLDHGWQDGDATYGDWRPHPRRFPDLGRTARRIADAGFIPGIWLAPIWLHPDSDAARADPRRLGEPIAPSNHDSPHTGGWNYWRPTDAMTRRLTDVFARLYDQGFRKFKLDMTYARMDLMIRLHERVYHAIKAVAPDAEVETHHPNPFFAVHTDAVRTNDVLCHDPQDWRSLTAEHFDVCERSAFGKVINLDHVGGNDPRVTEADFLEHLGMYREAVGYPVVSLLPHHLGDAAVEATRDLMRSRVSTPRAVSRFV